MAWLLRKALKFFVGVGVVAARAVFMIFNGLIIAAFVSFVPVLGLAAPIGVLTQVLFDHFGVKFVSGIGLVYFLFLSAFDAIVIGMMFLGRISLNEPSNDLAFIGNAFDLLFMMYGCFLGVTSLLIWGYYMWDPTVFLEKDVSFWRILLYVIDVGLRGFLADIMEYAHIETVLTPQGVMYHVNFFLKLIMAATLVSGAVKYHELTKGKGGILP